MYAIKRAVYKWQYFLFLSNTIFHDTQHILCNKNVIKYKINSILYYIGACSRDGHAETIAEPEEPPPWQREQIDDRVLHSPRGEHVSVYRKKDLQKTYIKTG